MLILSARVNAFRVVIKVYAHIAQRSGLAEEYIKEEEGKEDNSCRRHVIRKT